MINFDLTYSWSTNNLTSNAKVMLNNIGLSTASVHVGVRQGSIDAHNGVIGGYVEVQDISADGKLVSVFNTNIYIKE